MDSLNSSYSPYEQTNNWDLAVLIAVLLILFFLRFYKFLFVLEPSKLSSPIDFNSNSNFSDNSF